MRYILPPLFCAIGSIGAALAVEATYWPTKVSPPKGVKVVEHPCGMVLQVKGDTVPNEPWLQADVVKQIGSDGKVVRIWRVPTDQYPVGLKGDTLILAFGSEPSSTFHVGLDGSLKVVRGPPKTFLSRAKCPKAKGDTYCDVIPGKTPIYLLSPDICT
jgi:hypothetical protein